MEKYLKDLSEIRYPFVNGDLLFYIVVMLSYICRYKHRETPFLETINNCLFFYFYVWCLLISWRAFRKCIHLTIWYLKQMYISTGRIVAFQISHVFSSLFYERYISFHYQHDTCICEKIIIIYFIYSYDNRATYNNNTPSGNKLRLRPGTTIAPPGTTTVPPGTTTALPGTTTAPPGTCLTNNDQSWISFGWNYTGTSYFNYINY